MKNFLVSSLVSFLVIIMMIRVVARAENPAATKATIDHSLEFVLSPPIEIGKNKKNVLDTEIIATGTARTGQIWGGRKLQNGKSGNDEISGEIFLQTHFSMNPIILTFDITSSDLDLTSFGLDLDNFYFDDDDDDDDDENDDENDNDDGDLEVALVKFVCTNKKLTAVLTTDNQLIYAAQYFKGCPWSMGRQLWMGHYRDRGLTQTSSNVIVLGGDEDEFQYFNQNACSVAEFACGSGSIDTRNSYENATCSLDEFACRSGPLGMNTSVITEQCEIQISAYGQGTKRSIMIITDDNEEKCHSIEPAYVENILDATCHSAKGTGQKTTTILLDAYGVIISTNDVEGLNSVCEIYSSIIHEHIYIGAASTIAVVFLAMYMHRKRYPMENNIEEGEKKQEIMEDSPEPGSIETEYSGGMDEKAVDPVVLSTPEGQKVKKKLTTVRKISPKRWRKKSSLTSSSKVILTNDDYLSGA